MSSTKRVQFIIDAQDNASSKLAKLKTETSNLSKSVQASESKFIQFGKTISSVAKVAAVGMVALGGAATAFAVKAGFAAARIEELEFVLHAVAKANDIQIEKVKETVNGLRDFNIAHRQALEITNLFMQSQLDLNDALKLGNVAKDLAVIGAMDSSEATKLLIEATAGQSIMMLRQFGIVTTLDTLYEKYGKTVGKTSEELTETEKKQAFLNEIFEAGEKVAGSYDAAMDSVGKRYRSLTGRIIPDFIAQIGQAFTPAMAVIIDEITASIEKMSERVKNNQGAINQWGIEFTSKIQEIINWLKQNQDKLKETWEVFKKFGQIVFFVIEFIVKVFSFLQKALETVFFGWFMLIGKAQEMFGAFRNAWANAVNGMKSVFFAVWDSIKWGIVDGINFMIKKINSLISNINKVPGIDIKKIGGIDGRADGGQVNSSTPYIVGERGPELFVPNSSGTIIPNNQLSSGQNFTFNFQGAMISDKGQLINEIKQAINRELELSRYGIG